MLNSENFWYEKCFANNNDDSRINEILCSVKLETYELLMVKKGLNFTFSIV